MTINKVRSALLQKMKALEISQKEVCVVAGVSESQFSQWKNGRNGATGEKIIEACAKVIQKRVNRYEKVLDKIN